MTCHKGSESLPACTVTIITVLSFTVTSTVACILLLTDAQGWLVVSLCSIVVVLFYFCEKHISEVQIPCA